MRSVALACLLSLPGIASAATVTSTVGDKDCFGTNDACVEDGATWLPGGWGSLVQTGSDPSFTDVITNTASTVSWVHSFAAGAYTAASLVLRTAGIADIAGPYGIYVDGILVGEMPLDGYGHILVETFSFSFDPSLASDGSLTISFTPSWSDSWAIDYSEVTLSTGSAAVPVPAAGLLLAGAIGLGAAVSRRRRV
ncbi:MAG: VPLPA-CTERM sorting domain-containing protein [Paracoccaceae bacterium]